MTKTFFSLIFITIFFLGCYSFNQPKKVLRTDTSVVFPKEMITLKQPEKGDVFKKRFDYLPPIIPHSIKEYTLSITNNQCISCHTTHQKQPMNQSYSNCLSCHPIR